VFNPDNRPKNEPVVWVVKGENGICILRSASHRRQGDLAGVVITEGLSAGERVVAAGVSELHAGSRFESGRVNEDCNGYLSSVY
jgi:multidrug efflux pump subunit AcrA (membrane-fusion protein)